MDGFQETNGVIDLVATSSPEILDKALLRPGRFYHKINLDKPDIKGREQIFQLYLKKIKLHKEPSYLSWKLATLTSGCVGADIANICNEAALVAARTHSEFVSMDHLSLDIDRTIGGIEMLNMVRTDLACTIIAYHEADHSVLGWFLEHAFPLIKVSIVPRGSKALGFSQFLPKEDRVMCKEKIFDIICTYLGGRESEQVILGRVTTTTQDDLEKVTDLSYAQVAEYGFSDKIGLLSFHRRDYVHQKNLYNNKIGDIINIEVRELVRKAYERTVQLLGEHKEHVVQIAKLLLEKELLYQNGFIKVLSERPWKMSEDTNSSKRNGLQRMNN